LDSEEQTLRYYLSLFSFLIIYLIFLLTINSIEINSKIIDISKGESIKKISNKITYNENFFNKKIYYLLFSLSNKYYLPIKYGKFKIKKKIKVVELIKIISTKSNLDYRITIVEGWEKYQLNNYLLNYYDDFKEIPYNKLIANTYIINSTNSYDNFIEFLIKNKKDFFKTYKDNDLLKKYSIDEILVISSLVEKEAKNNLDKPIIASIIFNRLNLGMKLQIDASVIAAITQGKYRLNRSLTYKDLKLDNLLNTYNIQGIPKEMICYVGLKTIKIVLENPKSDFLFYFYNVIEKKHIFSKTYKEHKKKLNEHRKQTK